MVPRRVGEGGAPIAHYRVAWFTSPVAHEVQAVMGVHAGWHERQTLSVTYAAVAEVQDVVVTGSFLDEVKVVECVGAQAGAFRLRVPLNATGAGDSGEAVATTLVPFDASVREVRTAIEALGFGRLLEGKPVDFPQSTFEASAPSF